MPLHLDLLLHPSPLSEPWQQPVFIPQGTWLFFSIQLSSCSGLEACRLEKNQAELIQILALTAS